MSEQEYEFTESQEATFSELLKWLNLFSVLFMLAGVLIVGVAFMMFSGSDGTMALPGFGIGIAMLAIGFLFRRPMDNLQNIINTEGRDIAELMIAIKDFSQAFLSGTVVAGLFVLMIIWRLVVLMGGAG